MRFVFGFYGKTIRAKSGFALVLDIEIDEKRDAEEVAVGDV